MWKEKKSLSATLDNFIQNTMEKVWHSGSLVFAKIQENVASWAIVEKKQFVVHRRKKNSDCAHITKIKDEKIPIF